MTKLDAQSLSSEKPLGMTQPLEVAFFLGAGASVEAGVPATVQFVESFLESLQDDRQVLVKGLLDRLTSWASGQSPPKVVDIELLLEVLQKLADRERDPLSAFLGEGSLLLVEPDPAVLLKELRDFVKSKVIVEPDVVRYLEPLRGFVLQFRPLTVFSANYDTCIELFCSEHKLAYRDGFDEAWNPKVFHDEDIDLRLYKIHGSATWYRSDRGRYLKIPIRTVGSSVELITKERAESLMLYPAQKYEYVEPLFELLVKMKEGLASCSTLFVIGYSFRDDHIRRLFWDVARLRKDFQVVLISPKARQIYEQRLMNFDEKIPSPLAGRVICLPFQFGKVLPHLLNEVLPYVRTSRRLTTATLSNELMGRYPNWEETLLPSARAGDYEVLWTVLNKPGVREKPPLVHLFEAVVLGLIHAWGNEDHKHAGYFTNEYQKLWLRTMDELHITIGGQMNAKFFNANVPTGNTNFSNLLNDLQSLQDTVIKRIGWMTADINVLFVNEFKETLRVMQIWEKVNVPFAEYSSARGSLCSTSLQQTLKNVEMAVGTQYDGIDQAGAIENEIKNIEKNLILRTVDVNLTFQQLC